PQSPGTARARASRLLRAEKLLAKKLNAKIRTINSELLSDLDDEISQTVGHAEQRAASFIEAIGTRELRGVSDSLSSAAQLRRVLLQLRVGVETLLEFREARPEIVNVGDNTRLGLLSLGLHCWTGLAALG